MENSVKSPNKATYKILNWKDYNSSLQKRGRITLWIDAEVLRKWNEVDVRKNVVGEKKYPDFVISICLILGAAYHQKLRQTVGFVKDILSLSGFEHLPVPDYTTLSRRSACLDVNICSRLDRGEKLDISVDSTGLKVYGEGEWKVRKHGESKRRTWMKFHVGLNVNTNEFAVVLLTDNSVDDAEAAKMMFSGKEKQLNSFRGDGAYDDFKLRIMLGNEVKQIIPPPKDAVIQSKYKYKPIRDELQQRDEAILFINDHSREKWKENTGYHKRSLSETGMYRYKTIFGQQLWARTTQTQQTEVKIKCKILNKFTKCGMPNSQKN